jgi:hypothetical protein
MSWPSALAACKWGATTHALTMLVASTASQTSSTRAAIWRMRLGQANIAWVEKSHQRLEIMLSSARARLTRVNRGAAFSLAGSAARWSRRSSTLAMAARRRRRSWPCQPVRWDTFAHRGHEPVDARGSASWRPRSTTDARLIVVKARGSLGFYAAMTQARRTRLLPDFGWIAVGESRRIACFERSKPCS